MSEVPGDDARLLTPDRFWGFWRLLLQRPFEWFFRMRVYGAENVPRTGPAVIACNHIAGIDVVVLGAASPRTLRYMAKAELFTHPVAAWWLRPLSPVFRGRCRAWVSARARRLRACPPTPRAVVPYGLPPS